MRRKCERGRGNINADGAGAEVFVGDGCSQGASFGPMVAISRRGQGGRIYNNTRTRERLRRKCVKPAALTTHSPPKIFALPEPFLTPCPSTFSLPPRTLPLPHAAPTHTRRPHNTFSAESLLPPPHSDAPSPSTFSLPTQPRRTPADLTTFPAEDLRPSRALPPAPAAQTHTCRPHNTFPVEDLLPSPHSDTPCPSIFSPPSRTLPLPSQRRCTPADLTTFPAEDLRPSRAFSHSLPAHFRSPTQPRCTPAGCAMHSSPTSQHIPHRRPSPAPAAPPCLPFCSTSGTKKRHRTMDVRCRMSRSTVVAVGHWGW